MPNPTATDLLSDLVKWRETLDTASKVLELKGNVKKEVEAIKAVAKNADAIESDKDTVKQFQDAMSRVCHSGDDVVAVDKALDEIERDLNQAISSAARHQTADMETVENCKDSLHALLDLAIAFNNKLVEFRKCLDDSTEICRNLLDEFEREKAAAEKAASSSKMKGIGAAYGLGLGTLGLGIVAFFTNNWKAAGAMGAAAAGAAAGCAAAGVTSSLRYEELNKVTGDFDESVNNLKRCMMELDTVSDRLTTEEKTSKQIQEAIAAVIQRYCEKHRLSQVEEENQLLKQKMREMEEKMSQMGK